ncbi:MAG: hypothetical protein IKK58_04370 [Clostridia bacterium]|nr:hypothetical protein [Clostridia bacterium]
MKKLWLLILLALLLLSGCGASQALDTPIPSEAKRMDMWEAYAFYGHLLGGDGYFESKTYDEAIEYYKSTNGNVITMLITVEQTQNFLCHRHNYSWDSGYTQITYTVEDIKYQYNFTLDIGKTYAMQTSAFFDFRDPAEKREYFQKVYHADGDMIFDVSMNELDEKKKCELPEGEYETELIKETEKLYLVHNCFGNMYAVGEQYIVMAIEKNGIIYDRFAVPYKCDNIKKYFSKIHFGEYVYPNRDKVYYDMFEIFGEKP